MFNENVRFYDDSIMVLDRRGEEIIVEAENKNILIDLICNHADYEVSGEKVLEERKEQETFSVKLYYYQLEKETVYKIGSLVEAYPNIRKIK